MSGVVHLAVWVGLSILGAGPQEGARVAAPGVREASWTLVPRENRAKGLELFQQANQAVHQSEMKNAVALYRQALVFWDHPAFHYNLAIALLAVSRTLECHEQLEAATRYGPEPLGEPEKYQNAMGILAEVEGQLSRLELSCSEPGSMVIVDDRRAPFSCPGALVQWAQPGIHVVEVKKKGFHTTTKHLNLQPGERHPLQLNLYTEDQWTQTRSRWPAWMPWLVMGGGVGAVGLGGGIQLFSFREFDARVEALGSHSPETISYPAYAITSDLQRLLDEGKSKQPIAVTLYGAGVVGLGVASVLLSLNFPQPFLVDPESGDVSGWKPLVALSPMVVPGSRGVVLTLNF